ncbi:MAG: hypothetical protein AB7S44_03520 [Spirochaetales bacterium]
MKNKYRDKDYVAEVAFGGALVALGALLSGMILAGTLGFIAVVGAGSVAGLGVYRIMDNFKDAVEQIRTKREERKHKRELKREARKAKHNTVTKYEEKDILETPVKADKVEKPTRVATADKDFSNTL